MIHIIIASFDRFIPIIFILFVVISVIANIVKKINEFKPPGPKTPGAPTAKKSFMDIIEDVRRMAEGGPAKPGGQGGEQSGPRPLMSPDETAQSGEVRPMPKLRTLGEISRPPRQPETQSVFQGRIQEVRPVITVREQFATPSQVSIQKQKARERLERAIQEREAKIREAEAETRAIRERMERKIESSAFGKVGEIKTTYKAGRVDSVRIKKIFSSRDSLGDAIVLREILGPPRAMQKFGRHAY